MSVGPVHVSNGECLVVEKQGGPKQGPEGGGQQAELRMGARQTGKGWELRGDPGNRSKIQKAQVRRRVANVHESKRDRFVP
jgi:hypothetical protein